MSTDLQDPPVGLDPEDVHDDGGVDTDIPQPGELIIDAGGQLGFSVGGKQPTSAALTFVGGKIEVDGQFRKGQAVAVRIEAVVSFVGFKDQHDPKTGQVVGCERQQKARITGIELLES
jgi:hypothetical protein